ncbi:hypothetical protein FLLO111716_01825 [Flavobacterium longum]|uniref:TonB-dependent receptor domain-containing protein n=1 Tax=Flavobacterium longum TaxID=1299340 RepID=UPI0039ED54DF
MKKILLILLVPAIGFGQKTEKDSTAQKLDEIVLSASPKTFTNKNGNLKVDVANSIYKSVPSVLDLLAKLPKVQVSANREAVSIVGKGEPLIYIDNAAASIKTLNAMSVDDIKSVEIINNPSAKYEADGKAVILITRKRSRREGFQTLVSQNASFKKGSNWYQNLGASLKHGATEFRANGSFNNLHPWESNGNRYTIPGADIISEYLVEGFSKRRQWLYGGSIFTQFKGDDYLSLSVNGRRQADDFRFHTLTENKEGMAQNQIETVGNNDSRKDFMVAVLNYSNRTSSGNAGIFIGAQYSRLATPSVVRSFNNYNDTQFAPFVKTVQDFGIGAFSARIDYDLKYTDDIKLEAGGLLSTAKSTTDVANVNFEENTDVLSVYGLDEKIAAAYIQLSGRVKKVNWSAGIRAENTNVLGQNRGESHPAVAKNYTTIFPKAQLDFAIDSTKTVTLNYAKSISRPDFSAINQGITYINPYFVFTGNVNLNPAISDELSVNFQYKDKSLKIGYYKTKDNVNYSFLYDAAANLLTHRPENFDHETTYSIELTAPFAYKFWTTTNVCSINISEVEQKGAVKLAVKPYVYGYSNHQFALSKEWTFSVTGWGFTKRYQGILENNAFFIADLALSKTYKSWTFSLAANDLFRNMNFQEKFRTAAVSTTANYYVDAREFSAGIKYAFGKVKSNFTEKSVDENARRIR